MSNPNNNFENFFSDDNAPAMHKMQKPSTEAIMKAVIQLVGMNPQWYRDQALRMMVANGIGHISTYLENQIAAGKKPEVDINVACLCMVLAERLETSRRFASEEEKEMYPSSDLKQDNED